MPFVFVQWRKLNAHVCESILVLVEESPAFQPRLSITKREEGTRCQAGRIGRLRHTGESIFLPFLNRQREMMQCGVVYVQASSHGFQLWTTHRKACNKIWYNDFSEELRIIFLFLWKKIDGNEASVPEIP
jgi:hypothetical protein